MTDQEALRTIAAIAEWVRQEAPESGLECGGVIRNVSLMTARVDFERLDDHEAVALFGEVLSALETSDDSWSGTGAVD